MTITQHISIDLQQPGNMPMVHAVQGDEYSRKIEIELYSNGVSWNPPDGCEVAIRYGKPDGKGGIYAVLPDNTPAYSIAGNAITVTLAPQMVTVPGVVEVQVSIIKDRKDRISTFAFAVDVEADPSKGELKSENYVNWKSYYIPQTTGATVGQFLQISKVDDVGRIIEMASVENPAGEATNKAYEALRIANDVAQEMKDYSPSGTRAIAEAAMRTASSRLVAPPSASVGQYFRVKEVDANGVVTAVEAVDAPSGGGSSEPGKDGVDGEDGGYYTPVFTQTDENTVNVSFAASKEGMDDVAGQQIVLPAGKDGKDGKDGADGEPGKDGYTPVKGKDYFDGLPGNDGTSVSVKNITESTEDGGSNVVTFSDGKTITIRNGSKGSAGATGATGGKGADGRTPVRGTDYWTEADKADIVRQVLASMATPVAGIVDENNNIIITGELPDGAYKLRYEYADGTVAEIGTLNIISGPAYTNLADSTSADWLTNKRINSSKNIVDVTEAQRGDKTVVVTNFISISGVSKLHIKGLDIVSDLVNGSSTQNYGRVYDYAGATILGSSYSPESGINSKTHYTYADYDSSVLVFDIATMLKDWGGTHTSATHVRLGGILTGAAEDVIITADENIE